MAIPYQRLAHYHAESADGRTGAAGGRFASAPDVLAYQQQLTAAGLPHTVTPRTCRGETVAECRGQRAARILPARVY